MHLGRVAVWGALGVLVASSGCGPGEEGYACTDSREPSVWIQVLDARREALSAADVRVTYRLDGQTEQEAPCRKFRNAGNAPVDCVGWSAGEEEPGIFDLTATRVATGATASTRVKVEDGVCHVKTVDVTLTLPD